MICGKCGEEHVATRGGRPCMGHANVKDDDGRIIGTRPCRKNANRGSDKCGTHGASARQVKQAAAKREAEAKVIETARKLIPDADQLAPISNPLQRLLELAAEADGFRESLRRMANDLDGQIRYRGGGPGAEQLRAEVATYRAAMRDLTDMLVAIARLDIEKMLARVTVAQAEQSMTAMRAGMTEAGLDDDVKRQVIAGVGRHLRAVAS